MCFYADYECTIACLNTDIPEFSQEPISVLQNLSEIQKTRCDITCTLVQYDSGQLLLTQPQPALYAIPWEWIALVIAIVLAILGIYLYGLADQKQG